jgi:hypothetical protein
LSHSVPFQHRHKHLEIRVTDDGALELYLDNCLRKRREPGDQEPLYVWTNVELEWEEHHYIEARYWPSRQYLNVQVNRDPIIDTQLPG